MSREVLSRDTCSFNLLLQGPCILSSVPVFLILLSNFCTNVLEAAQVMFDPFYVILNLADVADVLRILSRRVFLVMHLKVLNLYEVFHLLTEPCPVLLRCQCPAFAPTF